LYLSDTICCFVFTLEISKEDEQKLDEFMHPKHKNMRDNRSKQQRGQGGGRDGRGGGGFNSQQQQQQRAHLLMRGGMQQRFPNAFRYHDMYNIIASASTQFLFPIALQTKFNTIYYSTYTFLKRVSIQLFFLKKELDTFVFCTSVSAFIISRIEIILSNWCSL